jgi:hypothetical protein
MSITAEDLNRLLLSPKSEHIGHSPSSGFPLMVKFYHRTPDPGVCYVSRIDWEGREMEVTNGSVRLYPEFDDVRFVTSETMELVDECRELLKSNKKVQAIKLWRGATGAGLKEAKAAVEALIE